MRSTLKLSAIALAAVFSLGAAAQTSSGSATPSGTGGAGDSATGGRSAPAVQRGAGTRNSESTKDDKVAKGDRKFIEQAAGSGMFEVQVSQLATTRAKSPDVKSFAGMLVDHHTKANDELTQLANAKGVELPAAPPRAMRNEVEKLAKENGDAFDKDFIKNVGIKAHEKDIKAFEKAGKDVKDPELKAWVTKTLPTLKEHLASAQKLQKGGGMNHDAASMGNAGATAGNAGATAGNGGATAGNGGTAGKSGNTGNAGTPTNAGTGGGASTKTGGGNGANKTGS
ncbi:DUF4142 domain-containing protein [Ramlibacter sp. MMS24-I3-19]|uniref:DUF4142 domain-containing protein n=1 Tax=Ramlibacter sp. MMS24-I3-19 TaxID=3416606 RepID=UPI003D02DA28